MVAGNITISDNIYRVVVFHEQENPWQILNYANRLCDKYLDTSEYTQISVQFVSSADTNKVTNPQG